MRDQPVADREGGAPNGAPPAQQPVAGSGPPAGAEAPRFRPVGAPFKVPQQGAPPSGGPTAGPAAAQRTVYRSSSAPVEQGGRSWATRWALPVARVALSLPLVQFAAVSAGLVLYALYLLGGRFVDEPSGVTLGLVALGAAVVCGISLLGFAAALRECPRHRLWLWSFVGSVVAALAAAACLALGVDVLPAVVAAGALFYAAIVAAICGVISICELDTGRPVDRVAGRPWRAWLWRVALALIAAMLAAAAAGLALSSFAASYVPAQTEFHLGSSVWQHVSHRSGLGLAGGVLALIAANAGLAALFGLLVHGAVRALGWWRGRLHTWWLGAAGVTVALGIIAWILDSSLPRW